LQISQARKLNVGKMAKSMDFDRMIGNRKVLDAVTIRSAGICANVYPRLICSTSTASGRCQILWTLLWLPWQPIRCMWMLR